MNQQMKPSEIWSCLETNEIEEVSAWDPNFELVQLSKGPLGYVFERTALPGLSISWVSAKQKFLARERWGNKRRALANVFSADGECSWHGLAAGPESVLFYGSNTTHEYVIGENYKSVYIEMDDDLAESLGWDAELYGLKTLSPACISRLMQAAMKITVDARLNQISSSPDIQEIIRDNFIRDCFIGRHTIPLQSKKATSDSSNAYAVVKRAESYLSRSNRNMTMADLAQDMNVSRRTLYRSFESWAGIGPHEYFTIQRLHHFKSILVSDTTLSITDAALLTGFEHFGRLAKRYREYFGELPRDTRSRISLP